MTDLQTVQRARAIVVDLVRFLLEAQALAAVRKLRAVADQAHEQAKARMGHVPSAVPAGREGDTPHFVVRLAALLEHAHELEAAGYGAPVIGTVLRDLERATAAERGELAPPKVCSICLSTIEPGDPPLERSGLCAECGDARGVFIEKIVSGLAALEPQQPWPTPMDVVSYAGELAAARVLPVLANGTIDPRGVT